MPKACTAVVRLRPLSGFLGVPRAVQALRRRRRLRRREHVEVLVESERRLLDPELPDVRGKRDHIAAFSAAKAVPEAAPSGGELYSKLCANISAA
jgi:hypothetical protein